MFGLSTGLAWQTPRTWGKHTTRWVWVRPWAVTLGSLSGSGPFLPLYSSPTPHFLDITRWVAFLCPVPLAWGFHLEANQPRTEILQPWANTNVSPTSVYASYFFPATEKCRMTTLIMDSNSTLRTFTNIEQRNKQVKLLSLIKVLYNNVKS